MATLRLYQMRKVQNSRVKFGRPKASRLKSGFCFAYKPQPSCNWYQLLRAVTTVGLDLISLFRLKIQTIHLSFFSINNRLNTRKIFFTSRLIEKHAKIIRVRHESTENLL